MGFGDLGAGIDPALVQYLADQNRAPTWRSEANAATPISQYIQPGFQQLAGQQAPQIDPTQQAQFRNAQLAQMQQLQGIAGGTQQGAGELAAQRQVANALAQQQAMARMARGGNAALAQRNAARNVAGAGLAGAGLSQQAAMQDQQMAQGLLGQLTGQGRQQDIGLATGNANLSQQQNAINNQQYLGLLQALQQQQQMAMQPKDPGMVPYLLGAAGQIGAAAAMSDERVKTDIADGDEDIDAMLDALVAKRYRYKDEARHGRGERVGIMAQDLERSRAGANVVVEVPDGKAIDLNKAISAALAATARLNKRLRDVERKAG